MDKSDQSFSVYEVRTERRKASLYDVEKPNVRVFRCKPGCVEVQFRSGKTYHQVSLPFETARAIAQAIIENSEDV